MSRIPYPLESLPGDFGRSRNCSENLFGLSWSSDGPLVLPPVLGRGRLRQTQGEGGTFAGRQRGELAWVDGGWRRLGEGNLGAPPLAFVLHVGLFLFRLLLFQLSGFIYTVR